MKIQRQPLNTMVPHIVVRGKRPDTGDWVKGGYFREDPPPVCFSGDVEEKPKHYIIAEQGFADWGMPRQYMRYSVDPASLGRGTGVPDKYGIEVFEGDILVWDTGCRFVVRYKDGQFVCIAIGISHETALGGIAKDCQIIGNMTDTPELLEEFKCQS